MLHNVNINYRLELAVQEGEGCYSGWGSQADDSPGRAHVTKREQDTNFALSLPGATGREVVFPQSTSVATRNQLRGDTAGWLRGFHFAE